MSDTTPTICPGEGCDNAVTDPDHSEGFCGECYWDGQR